jgi:cytochrome c
MDGTTKRLALGAFATIVVIAGGAAASAADASRGRELFERRCTGCHALDQVKEGPRLRGVFGRAAGRDPQFPYSDALRGASLTWDEATLDRWLTDPESLVPGNDMAFRLDNAAQRADIIEYLRRVPGK